MLLNICQARRQPVLVVVLMYGGLKWGERVLAVQGLGQEGNLTWFQTSVPRKFMKLKSVGPFDIHTQIRRTDTVKRQCPKQYGFTVECG